MTGDNEDSSVQVTALSYIFKHITTDVEKVTGGVSKNDVVSYAVASPLQEGAKQPPLSSVGGKAQSLMEASSASKSFNVPPGFVLTVDFFQPWMDILEEKSSEWKNFKLWLSQKRGVTEATGSSPLKATSSPMILDVKELGDLCESIKNFCKKELVFNTTQKKCLQDTFRDAFSIRLDDSIGGSESSSLQPLYAVRSSSPEEDLEGTSFAGGYETTLGVPAENLEEAIVASFKSVFDERVVQYKHQHNMSSSILKPRIAVIVQQQLRSDVSGVSFSINPQTNCYDEVLINANYGLGESIVAGQVTPDSFVVDKVTNDITSKSINSKTKSIWIQNPETQNETEGINQTSCSKKSCVTEKTNTENLVDEPCLTETQVLEVAKLTIEVEEYYKKPMDIEWSYENNKLYLLQARPITAYVPLFPEMLTPPGSQKYLYMDVVALTQGFDKPMSMLGGDVWHKMVVAAKPSMELIDGSDSDGKTNVENACFVCHGKMYGNTSTMIKGMGISVVSQSGKAHGQSINRILTPEVLQPYSVTDTPPTMKQSASRMVYRTLYEFSKSIYPLFWFESTLQDYITSSEAFLHKMWELREKELDDYSFEELTNLCIKDLRALCEKIGFIVTCLYAQWRLGRLFTPEDDVDQYLQKLQMDLPGNPTSRMGHKMCELASYDDIQNCTSGEEFEKKLKDGTLSPKFKEAYDQYMMEFGCRCISEIEISTKRSYESPSTFFEQLKLIDIKHNAINTVKERRLEAYNILLEKAKQKGYESKFKKYEEMQRKGWGYREHPKFVIVTITDVLRRKALKLATKWKNEGRLDHIEDVFDLRYKEIVLAQENKDFDLRNAIEQNRIPLRAVSHVKQWPLLVDSRGRILKEPRPTDLKEGEFACDPISPGVIRGKANILKTSPYEKPLKKGEILVTHATDPGWTPIFINASGVVLEVGGSLQHGAIIAREYGLPCVSGLADATDILKDGQWIEVDGTRGMIRILNEEEVAEVTTQGTN